MFGFLNSPESWLSLLMLSTMEIVLGIDNLIFVSILAGRLPRGEQDNARRVGMAGAFMTRLALLGFISWIVHWTEPLFSIGGQEFSGKSIILICGGLFLIYKATTEIHHKLEGEAEQTHSSLATRSAFWTVILQITILDIVFSLDSVITAVGMTDHITIMVLANVVALIVMLIVGGIVHNFIERHPTIKILALSFLLMIGLVLMGDGFGMHVPKGYVYFAMGFSVFVELINLNMRRKGKPVHLHNLPPR
jgi:predicted tellurium resistance membrane protein TerC